MVVLHGARSGGAAGKRRTCKRGNASVDVGLYRLVADYAPVSVYRADRRIAIAVRCGSGDVAATPVCLDYFCERDAERKGDARRSTHLGTVAPAPCRTI
jgi:hypothetical protein